MAKKKSTNLGNLVLSIIIFRALKIERIDEDRYSYLYLDINQIKFGQVHFRPSDDDNKANLIKLY